MNLWNRLKSIYDRFTDVRYVVIGACTTAVSVGLVALLTKVFHWEDNLSNIVSIIAAVIFAYVANKIFVFRSHTDSFGALAAEALKFFAGRAVTMLVEVFGVVFFDSVLGQDVVVAKVETQILVLVGNYLISRFIVFRKKPPRDAAEAGEEPPAPGGGGQ
ncbi:MAG: GtrA family protein [Oscillospiraceae bacterium]|nr:GtrA family protein [Oscillospiraceae bacterium]